MSDDDRESKEIRSLTLLEWEIFESYGLQGDRGLALRVLAETPDGNHRYEFYLAQNADEAVRLGESLYVAGRLLRETRH